MSKTNWDDFKPLDPAIKPTKPTNWADFKPIEKTGAARKLADTGLALGEGVVSGVQMLTNVAGADNAVSRTLGGAAQKLAGLQSPERRAEKQARSQKIDAAEQSGSLMREIGANLGAFAEAPIDTTINALGTSAPTLAAAALTGGGSVAAQLASRALPVVMGAGQGTGAVKGAIYDTVKNKLLPGETPEQAEARAVQAQAYDGENIGQIGLGGVFGGLAGGTGIEGAAARLMGRRAATNVAEKATEASLKDLGKAAGVGALKEAPIEGLQGGQERVASNIALQNEGFDTPTFEGAVGQGVLEAAASAPLGGGFGVAERLARNPAADAPTAPPAPTPADGAPGAPAPFVNPPSLTGSSPEPLLSGQGGGLMGAADPPRAVVKPSEAMGIDPSAGPLSRVAAAAVDEGVTDQTAMDEARYAAATEEESADPTKDAARDPDAQILAQIEIYNDDMGGMASPTMVAAKFGVTVERAAQLLAKVEANPTPPVDELFPLPASAQQEAAAPANQFPTRVEYEDEVRRQLGDLQEGDTLTNDMGDVFTVDAVMRNKAGEIVGMLPREREGDGSGAVLDIQMIGTLLLPTPYTDTSGNRKMSEPGKVTRKAANVQDPAPAPRPEAAAPEAPADEAPAPAGSDGAAAAGVPDAGRADAAAPAVAPAPAPAAPTAITKAELDKLEVPKMTEDQLRAGLTLDGIGVSRRAKIRKEIQKRGLDAKTPAPQPQEPSNETQEADARPHVPNEASQKAGEEGVLTDGTQAPQAEQAEAQRQEEAPALLSDQVADQAPAAAPAPAAETAKRQERKKSLRDAIERRTEALSKAAAEKADNGEATFERKQQAEDFINSHRLSDGYEVVYVSKGRFDVRKKPAPDAEPEPTRDAAVNVPPAVSQAMTGQMNKQKGRITRLKREAAASGMTLEDKASAQTKLKAAEATLRQMRLKVFDAEDAAVAAIDAGNLSRFDDFEPLFPDAYAVLKAQIRPAPDAEYTFVGRNRDGKTIMADKRGVRSYTENGIRITETVSLRPTRQGMQIDRGELKPDFMTVEELAEAAPAPAAAELQPAAKKPVSVTKAGAGAVAIVIDPSALRNPAPAAKPDGLTEKEAAAKAKMFGALGKLAALASKNTRLNWTPEEEQQLLPIVIELFDGAMDLGAVTFQKAVRYVREFIATGLNQQTADAIPFETLQGAYIHTARKFKDQGATSGKEVMSFDSLAELEALAETAEEANTGAPENGNATQQLDRTSTGALDGAPSQDVRAPDGERVAGPGADRGGRGDGASNARADDAGGNAGGSLGGDTGVVPVPGRGTGADAKDAKKRRVSRTRGTDAGPGIFGPTGGLSDNPAPNAPKIAAPQPTADDFTIGESLDLGEGGQKTKFKNNVAAIRLVRDLEATGRMATADEQAVLAKYVGWGGLPQAFDANNTSWTKEFAEISELMSPEDLAAARQSTRYAHYTSREIIVDGIYAAMRHFGFTGGKTLEAGAGVGNFIGMMPADMRSAGRFTAIEREPFSSAIARQLYPQQSVQRADFTEFKGTDAYFDAAVGNPPFASDPQTDRSGRKHLSGLSLHNYFFAKSVDMLREGGIMAQVVTNSFMDAAGDKARRYISDRVELLGAIRLPNSAFAKNANTEVTTDLIFFKKRPDSEVGGKAARADAKRWLDTGKYTDARGKVVALNQYFIDNPSMMLGEFGAFGTMYGPDQPALVARPGQDTLAMLKEAVGNLPAGVYQSIADTGTSDHIKAAVISLNKPPVKEGGYFIEDGKLIQRLPDIAGEARGVEMTAESQWTAKTKLGEPGFNRIKALATMRVTVRSLLAAEISDDAKSMKVLRADLNAQYDAYIKEHGLLNDTATLRVFDDDPDYPLLASLEHGYTPGIGLAAAKRMGVKPQKSTAKKGPIFTQRVVAARTAVQKVETPADALAVSMAERGKLDAAYIGQLLGMEPEQVLLDLSTGDKPLLFRDPSSNEYVLRDAYLSGNVRAKLTQAKQAGMFANITALEAVQPEDVASHEITARLGSPWVPTEVYRSFAQELYGENSKVLVGYMPINSSFVVTVNNASDVALTNTWGTREYPGDALVQAVMNNRQVKVTYRDQDGKTHTDVDATERANAKAQEIKERFNDWLFADADRSDILTKAYNETNNNYVTRIYEGSNMTFPGKVPDSVIKFRRHQRNAIARIVQDRTALLDHVVGAGKTFTVISAAMELKRTGLARKPMVAVPNHLVKQWAADFYRLYPGANVLTATKKDFEKGSRRKFLARIATGDWDAVVIAHSSYGFIKPSPEFEAEFNGREIQKILATIKQVEDDDGDKQTKKRTVKQLEGIKERLENRIRALRDKPMDDLLDFEQIGVDQMFVDEAHMFKNLMYSTKMQGVAGLNDPSGSQRAYDMYVKTNQVMEKNGRGQGVVFATGTPVSNSLAEMYHMMRYLMPAQMKELGFDSFDAWANTYASVEQVWLQAPSGDGFKAQNRMSNFVNTPELLKMFDQVSDTVTMDDIKKAYSEENDGAEFPLPKLKGGRRTPVSLEKSEAQNAYMDEIAQRAKAIEQRKGPPQKGQDNILVVMSDARKAAMDIRLVDPDIVTREKGGRIDRSTDEVVARYKQYDSVKGTQLVFSDLGTPLKHAKKELKEYEALQDRILAATEDVATSATLGSESAMEIMEDAEAAQAEIDAMGPDWLSAVKSALRGFSIYDDFKAALIEKGVPEAEIAFIHDYNTDDQKASLFRKVNAGQIRVLLGSTQKLGAGTNVQERLVALHHLDVPWRPSDVEQREGRIERQGNLLMKQWPDFEIEILAYVTQDTLDMRMWQVQETKLKMINQLRTRKIGREIDNAFEDMELSAGEMQAAATGDMDLLKEIQLRADVKKLEQRRRSFDGQKNDLISRKKRVKETLAEIPPKLAKAEEEAKFAAKYQSDRYDNRPPFAMNIDGKDYTDASEALAYMREKDEAMVDVTDLAGQVTQKKAPLAITINGEPIKNRATMAELFADARGDLNPIAWTFGDETYRRRTVLANGIRSRVLNAMADEQLQQVGTIGDYAVAVEGSTEKDGTNVLEVTLSRGGKVVMDNSFGISDSAQAPARVITQVENLIESAVREADYLERRLDAAKKSAAELDKTADLGEWPDQGKLDTARAAHKELLSKLKQKDDGLPTASAENALILSASEYAARFAGSTPNYTEGFAVVSEGGGVFKNQPKNVFDTREEAAAWIATQGSDTAFNRKDEGAPFFSALSREIEALPTKSAPVLGWSAALTGLVKSGKVKADEVEWSGLNEWLRLQTGKISKEQVMAYLDANGVQVTETVLGAPDYSDVALWWNDEGGANEAIPFDELSAQDQSDAAQQYADEVGRYDDGDRQTPKYSQYTLPGGENYREVLLTLPDVAGQRQQAMNDRFNKLRDQVRAARPGEANQNLYDMRNRDQLTGDELVELAAIDKEANAPMSASFKSSHWDQANILAHIRVNDRTDADGKRVLFVEEIQSDWGQEGKKQGFGTVKRFTIRDQNGDIRGDFGSREEAQKYLDNPPPFVDGARSTIREVSGGGVPLAPFVGNTDKWLALALKRVVKMAVDGGYDRVAFVNGEQSAARYDLSKQVDSISWESTRQDGAAKNVELKMPGKNPIRLRVDGDGAVLAAAGPGFTQFEGKQLDDIIGKDLATKIMGEKVNGSLSGDGLRVGGDGMKAFYDKIVPAALKDVLKKVGGGQVEVVSMQSDPNIELDKWVAEDGPGDGSRAPLDKLSQPGFTITDTMREKADGGLPMFERVSGVDRADQSGDTRFYAVTDTSPDARRNIGVLERAIARDGDGTRDAAAVHPYEARLLPNDDALQEIAEAFGSRLQGFGLRSGLLAADTGRFGFFNGVRTGGTVFVAAKGNTRPHLAILGHELGHELRTRRPDLYDRLVQAIRPYIDQKKYADEFLKSAVAKNAGNLDKQREEFIGEVLSDGFMDRDFWRALGNKNPSLLRQVGAFVMNMVESVLAKVGYTKKTEKYLTDYKAVMTIAGEVMAEFGVKRGALGVTAFNAKAPANNAIALPKNVAQEISGSITASWDESSDLFQDLVADQKSAGMSAADARVALDRLAQRLSAHQGGPFVVSSFDYDVMSGELESMAAVLTDRVELEDEPEIKTMLRAVKKALREIEGASFLVAGEQNDTAFNVKDTASRSMAGVMNNVREAALPAGYVVNDFMKSSGKVSWWAKSVGTMYDLAQRQPLFKPVFETAQKFLNDVAFYASEAANLAPNILPKLETLKDIFKSPLSAADSKAIATPIFEGTLVWGRDPATGKPIKMEELEARAAEMTTDQKAQEMLRKRLLDPGVMRMWQGLPEEQYNANIESRYASQVLKAGTAFTPAELKAQFGLDDKQVGLYQEFRKATDKSLTDMTVADIVRFGGQDLEPVADLVLEAKTLEEAAQTARDYLVSLAQADPARDKLLSQSAAKIMDKAASARDLMDRGYAPLSRFGKYSVDVVGPDGDRLYFGLFESQSEANKMVRQMQGNYPDATVSSGTMSAEAYKLFAGVTPETLELFGEMLGLESTGNDAQDRAFQEYIKLAKNQRSAMKRLIHRKGIAGFTEDPGRVLSGFIYSNSRKTASSLNMGKLKSAVNDINETKGQGELADVAMKLADYVANPVEEAQAFRSLLFAQYLGGSVASAMLNALQPVQVTFPWLSQYGGPVRAAARLQRAIRDVLTKADLEKGLSAALKHAEEMGIVSPQEVFQLQAQAAGRASLSGGDGTRLGSATAAASNTLSRVSLAWGKLFGAAEQFNRRTTFIAAYRTAQEQRINDPAKFAEKAVNETQFIYSKANKPQWARGAIGATVFTFKQYSISYVELMHRMYTRGGPEGKKAALLGMGVLVLMSGVGGLPFIEDVEDVVDGFMQRVMNRNFSSKQAREEFFAELLGEDGAAFLNRGFSGLPGAPVDVSGRLGLGNMLPGTGIFQKKDNYSRDILELAGPGGDFAKRILESAGKTAQGEILGQRGAVMTLSPVAARNLALGFEMAESGMYSDRRGNKVIDVTGSEALGKAIGFQPASVDRVQDTTFREQRMLSLNKIRESEIAGKWARGVYLQDPEAVQNAKAELAAWNENNPSSPIRINMRQIFQRVQYMKMDKTERLAKTAPKELRAGLRERLEELR